MIEGMILSSWHDLDFEAIGLEGIQGNNKFKDHGTGAFKATSSKAMMSSRSRLKN